MPKLCINTGKAWTDGEPVFLVIDSDQRAVEQTSSASAWNGFLFQKESKEVLITKQDFTTRNSLEWYLRENERSRQSDWVIQPIVCYGWLESEKSLKD